MGLAILRDSEGQAVSSAAVSALIKGVEQERVVTVVTPSSRSAVDYQRSLARNGFSLGVTAATLVHWAQELWGRYGDGTRLATAGQLRALAWERLGRPDSPLPQNPGTAALVAALAESAPQSLDAGAFSLSKRQRDAVLEAQALGRQLQERGLVSRADLYDRLPESLANASERPYVILAGFTDMDASEVALLARCSVACDVFFAQSSPEGPAGEASRTLALALAERARQASAPVRDEPAPTVDFGRSRRVPALQWLLEAVFSEAETVAVDGREVLLLEAAGPEAEAELLARAICGPDGESWDRTLVVTGDPDRLWRELSPKLARRGRVVRGDWRQNAATARQTRLFLAFAEQVEALARLARSWQGPDTVDAGALSLEEAFERVLKQSVESDHGWWPPRAVVDYLFAGPIGVDRGAVFSLDRSWRGRRSLTPAQALEELRCLQREGSPHRGPFVACLERLEQGDLGAAAQALLQNSSALKSRDAHQSLMAVALAAREADELEGAPLRGERQLGVVRRMLEAQKVHRSPERVPDGEMRRRAEEGSGGLRGAPLVDVVTPREGALRHRESYDAVVLCGQTAAEDPVERRENARSQLLEALGLGPVVPAVEAARARAWSIWSAASSCVLMERATHTEGADETQPSPMLAELLACLAPNEEGSKAPVIELDERRYSQNLSPEGRRPGYSLVDGLLTETVETVALEDAASMAPARAGLLLENLAVAADGAPVLSPTAVEAYLECPRRWNFERGLRTGDVDASCTPMARGSLAHKALELAERRRRQLRLQGQDVPLRELVRPAFERLVVEGALSAPEPGQEPVAEPMLPHTMAEEQSLRDLLERLENVAEFQEDRLAGFEPVLFEERFCAPYAGVAMTGCIDRVDVDESGNLLVVDYKNKSRSSASEYGLEDKSGNKGASLDLWMPRHVQGLMYARIAQNLPSVRAALGGREPRPVGAVYLFTGAEAALAGATAPEVTARVFGPDTPQELKHTDLVQAGAESFEELLDRVEDIAREAVRGMTAGEVPPRPCDPSLCRGCPVLGCEKRRAR